MKIRKASIIMILSFILLFFCGYKIVSWKLDNNKTKKIIDNINDKLELKDLVDSDLDMIEFSWIDEVPEKDDYWKYINLPLQSVNFNNLRDLNNDTVAFVSIPNTNINYPVVQSDNNNFYLDHTYDKSKNNAGWVFLDYRNKLDELSINSVFYAHGRVDKTMFGTLKNVLSKAWLSNADNYYIRLITPEYSSIWQIFSVYKIETESYYLQSNFSKQQEQLEFYDTLLNRSIHDFNTILSLEDKIITLSSCYNEKEKVVLHAKLIKQGYYKD